MTRKFTYSNLPSIRRTHNYRKRQVGSKRTERICQMTFLLAVTKESHLEVALTACHASPSLLLSTYRMPDYKLCNVRDILECLVRPYFAVLYLLRRSYFSWRALHSVPPRRIVGLYAYLENPAIRKRVAESRARLDVSRIFRWCSFARLPWRTWAFLYAKSDCRTPNGAMLWTHVIQYR